MKKGEHPDSFHIALPADNFILSRAYQCAAVAARTAARGEAARQCGHCGVVGRRAVHQAPGDPRAVTSGKTRQTIKFLGFSYLLNIQTSVTITGYLW